MSKKWIGIILLSALFLLVGCGKESVENKKLLMIKKLLVVNLQGSGSWNQLV
nr:hypothetical protein [Listeria monocytogenes]